MTDACNDEPGSTFRHQTAVVVAWMLVLALLTTHGEWLSRDSLPMASMDVPTVPLFNAWTIGWNADQLLRGFPNYWQAPIFYPAVNAFAFSEPQPATLLVAPIVWATGTPIFAYKVWLLLSLFFNGLSTCSLLKHRGHSLLMQLAGGSAMLLLPIIHGRIDVLQLVPIWGILWFWSSVFRMRDAPTVRRGLIAGTAFAICFALCTHHGLFLSLLMIPCSVVFWGTLRQRKFAVASFVAVVTASLLIAPIVLPLYRASREHEFQRKPDLVKKLSAKPVHYLNSPPNSLIHVGHFDGPQWRQFCVGWVRMAFAMIGIIAAIWMTQRRRWIVFLTLMTIVAFGCSLGLNIDIGGWKPWQSLIDSVPGVGMVRSVFRFAWFVQIAVVLLAVEGAAALQSLMLRWSQSETSTRFRKTAGQAVVVTTALLIAFEILPKVPARGGVPDVNRHAGWISFVADHVPDGKSIACLPMANGTDVAAYAMTTRWMIYGLKHRKPMVNGYSGFFPPEFAQLRVTVNKAFPSTQAFNELINLHVRLLVVYRSYCKPHKIMALNSGQIAIDHVLADDAGVDVYRLTPANEQPND